jgi:large subunit ribosomal protein L20
MRVKRGVAAHKKHKKVLKSTKGYLGSNHKLIKRAREAMWHAGDYAHAHRRRKGGDFRVMWISRINAALTPFGIRYSEFIAKLDKKNIKLNRKVIALMALDKPEVFAKIVNEIQ